MFKKIIIEFIVKKINYRDNSEPRSDSYASRSLSRRLLFDDENDDEESHIADGYIPNRPRQVSSSHVTHVNKRIYPGPSSPQVLPDDDEPMPRAIRQRRLPLISTLPLVTSIDYYSNPYRNTSKSDISIGTAGSASGCNGAGDTSGSDVPLSVRYPINADIPSPSPNSTHNFRVYRQENNYGVRLPGNYGWREPNVLGSYYGSMAPHNRTTSDVNSACTIVYAGSRMRPTIRVIKAQPGNIPLSDSDNDEPRWAIV
ncbi:unnamed protein product [Thelazia callipaeda]|uniref:ZM domain-containing protein n=1 Tax=Thelazia callipaeda TaxID=103827 RepID=A0A0N5CZ91_THECL|nr:unnamed protein product [Thelazia callipaeda]